MIVVIADDLSGAAELAGVGFRLGLSAEVHLEFDPNSSADLVAVDTDSRSRDREEAIVRVARVGRDIRQVRPAWIYKKTDSVFRGHLAAEIGAILDGFGLERCRLIPANPSKDRVIENGRYRIAGVPLHETVFAEDPEFPVMTDDVAELLGDADPRIEIPASVNRENLAGLTDSIGEGTLPGGGADFFESILKQRLGDAIQEGCVRDSTLLDWIREGRRLFICGSKASWPERRRTFEARGWPVFALFEPRRVAPFFQPGRPDLIGISESLETSVPGDAETLVAGLGKVAAEEIRGNRDIIDAVFLEGGATAVAVLRELSVNRLKVVGEAGPGAPLLQAAELPLLCPKPGSYPWPEGVFE